MRSWPILVALSLAGCSTCAPPLSKPSEVVTVAVAPRIVNHVVVVRVPVIVTAPVAAVDGTPPPGMVAIDDLVRNLRPFGLAPHGTAEGADAFLAQTTDSLRRSFDGPDVIAALDAVVAAPSSAPARYLLACTLSQKGMHDQALATLQALRAAASTNPSCADALLNLPDDDLCMFTPDEIALAAGLTPSPVRRATVDVIASLATGDVGKAAPYVGAQATFSFFGEECDEACVDERKLARAELVAEIRGAAHRQDEGEGYTSPDRLFCDESCCRGPNPSFTHAPLVHVREVCFRGGAHPTLTSLVAGVDG